VDGMLGQSRNAVKKSILAAWLAFEPARHFDRILERRDVLRCDAPS
jgi:hypothetical protein